MADPMTPGEELIAILVAMRKAIDEYLEALCDYGKFLREDGK